MAITCFETPWLKAISEKNVLILENNKNDFSKEIKMQDTLKNVTIDKLPHDSTVTFENIHEYVKQLAV